MSDHHNERSNETTMQMSSNLSGVRNDGGRVTQSYQNSTILISGSSVTTDVGGDTQLRTSISSHNAMFQHQTPKTSQSLESNVAALITGPGSHVTQIITSVQGPVPCDSKENLTESILKNVHKHTWTESHVNVGETFKGDKFPELSFEVHPQLAQSPNFYHGGHQVAGYKKGAQKGKKLEMVKKAEYMKDSKFTFYGISDDDNAVSNLYSAESLINKIHEKKDKPGVLGVVAQAGAGKTTCMRRWARSTMEKSGMTEDNGFIPSEGSRFRLVHFIDLKSIEYCESTTLQDMLFKDVFTDAKFVEAAYSWLFENQGSAVIFLDGLDQTRQITEDDAQPVGHLTQTNTVTLLYNLLSKNYLPRVQLIIASREHSAASLPQEAWFDDVITLTGFTEEDAKKLFNAITADANEGDLGYNNVNNIPASVDPSVDDLSVSNWDSTENPSNWDKLVKTSSALLLFISIPAFLMFTAIVYKTYGSAPSSVTDLMAKVIQTLQYSLNIQERRRIWIVIHKLKQLSHDGMKKGLVIFSEDDLKKYGLSQKDVRDLFLMVPRSRLLSHHLIEGDNVFFFSHQILQEFFSACWIVEMSLSDFKEFVQTQINIYHWSVVRRFVSGLIFSKHPTGKLLQISDKNEKQHLLRESLISELEKSRNHPHPFWLELYAVVYESDDDLLIQMISQLQLTSNALRDDAVRLVGLLMTKSRGMHGIKISHLAKYVPILIECLKDIKVKIQEVYVEEAFDDFSILNKLLEHVESDEVVVDGWWNHPSQEDYVRPHWMSIQRLRMKYGQKIIIMDNRAHDGCVKLSRPDGFSEEYFGTFDKDGAKLTVNPKVYDAHVFNLMATAASILAARFVSFEMEGKLPTQFLLYKDLLIFQVCEIAGCEVEEVKLSCRGWNENITEDKITSLARQLHVKILILKIHPKHVAMISASLTRDLQLIDCELRIEVFAHIFNVGNSQELSNQLHQGHVFDCLELVMFGISLAEFISFIRGLNSTKRLQIRYRGDTPWLIDTDNHEQIEDAVKYAGSTLEIVRHWNGQLMVAFDPQKKDT